MTKLFDKVFRNRRGQVVIWQNPNPPLWIWIICEIFQRLFTSGNAHRGLVTLGGASLFAWSYLELTAGDSLFRRILGGIVMILLLVSFFR